MASDDEPPFFSIIISTRDRPALFQVALSSVLQQRFVHKEIVVVIDGSSDENLALYTELESQNPYVKLVSMLVVLV